MIKETLSECTQCQGHGFNIYHRRCSLCKGDGATVTREGLPNGRTETISWSESLGLSEPEPIVAFCIHGYGGFFRCPRGCHFQGMEQAIKEADTNLDYFYKRLDAHRMSLGFDEPRIKE